MPRPVEQIRRLMYNGEDVGMGFNSDTGQAVGTALDFTPPAGEPGQTSYAEATIITSQESLSSALGMSLEVSGHYGMISAGLKAEFQKNSTFNSTSTFVLARSKVENQIKRGRNFRVTDAANRLLQANRFEEFQDAFGDSFVRGVVTGGEYYALIRMTSQDSTVQSQLALTLQAEINGGLAGGAFKAAYNEANTQSRSRSEYHIKFYQRGGSGDEISTTLDVDEMKERLQSFPSAIQAHPYPYEIEVARYDTIPLPIPPKQQQENFLLALADADAKRMSYIRYRNDLLFAAEHPEFFIDPPPPEALTRDAELYTRALNAISGHVSRLVRGELPADQYFFEVSSVRPEIVLPIVRLKRRTSQDARTFVDWYSLRMRPEVLREDRRLLDKLAAEAIPRLQDFGAIRDPGGNPEATELARAQALKPLIDEITEFAVLDDNIPTLGHLPDMVPPTLQKLRFWKCGLRDIRGIGRLRNLRELSLEENEVDDITELAELEELRVLDLTRNKVSDLAPLTACTKLESLAFGGNHVLNLTPLASLRNLQSLSVALYFTLTHNDQTTHTFYDNPLISIDPLRELGALGNPFLSADELSVRVVRDVNAEPFTGVANRVGRTHVFKVDLTRGAEAASEEWIFMGLFSLAQFVADQTLRTVTVLVDKKPLMFSMSTNGRSKCRWEGRPAAPDQPRPYIEVQSVG